MKRISVIMLVLLLTALPTGCGKAPASTENSSLPVKVMTVTQADMQLNYNVSGQIKASVEVTIVPKVTGRVASVNVKIGDQLKKGQILFQIDSQEGRNQLTQSEASLDITQVNYETALQALNDAQVSYDRNKSLFEVGALSKTDMESATTKLVNAQFTVKQAQQQMEQAKASLSTAATTYSDYSVVAPMDGLVGEINVEIGQMVSQATQSAVVVNINDVKVDATVPESVVNNIQLGTKVPVTVKILGKFVEGTVTAISPKASSTTMGYPVEVTIENPSGDIKPGMTANVNLFTGTLKNVIVLPVDTVIEQDGQHIVFIIENNKAQEVSVEVGESNDTQVEITKGLSAGQIVVTDGNKLLSDGQAVRVITEQAGESQ